MRRLSLTMLVAAIAVALASVSAGALEPGGAGAQLCEAGALGLVAT